MNSQADAITGPQLLSTCEEALSAVQAARAAGKRVGLVPTMGALHEGHLSLVRAACGECDTTAVTIFVNPSQFGPNDDFDAYPRTLDSDLETLSEVGVDFVFAPSTTEIYPESFSTYIEPSGVSRLLEGECRPGHFRGVATIVLKLFNVLPANAAFFGHKDYQQSLVIRKMVADLNLPLDIRVCPTVREADGLALSSRNAYLSSSERERALSLSRSLRLAAELVNQGELDSQIVLAKMRQTINGAGVTKIDYVALADPETLAPVDKLNRPVIALVAAHVGHTRLIDNLRIDG